MEIFYIIIILATLDITGRVITLIHMMNYNKVKNLNYKNWVLIVAFLNFAFVFYWLIGRAKQ